ncbi:ATP-binding protein [Reinekea sp. G2M2-21]|uniref:ATP-binding protein n=1 Tax=Reinekea sp. G2M2-21 TaxID=2788942 RepID=UPI0018A8F39E|nr:ATP-binding protein [Reinekea sp. G2M2-21]
MKKLSLSLLSLILLSIIALGMFIDVLFDRYFSTEEIDPLRHQKVLAEQLAFALNEQSSPEEFIQAWQNKSPQNELLLLSEEDLPLPENLWQQLKNGQSLVLETEVGLTIYLWLAQHQQLLAFSPDELINREETPMVNLLLTTGFYLGILLLILLWLLPLVRSLRGLRRNALAYGKGDFSARLAPSRFTYIDDIEHTFNRMAEQIETLIQDNRLISSAVSHDLRTPLARLRFGIDILSETENPEERQKYQEHLSNDIDEMQSLVEALLNYARLEQSLVTVQKEPVDVLNILVNFRDSHPLGVVTIDAAPNTNTTIAGQPTYLKMLLHNILNNALHYGNSKILVQVSRTKEHLDIHIHDDGPGIAEQHRSTLFKPFVRGETQNSPQGFGMGLAIAERIAYWHNGTISIAQSSKLGGAEFIIRLSS